MSEARKILKCPICDTIVEVLDHVGVEIVCCGPAMEDVSEQFAEGDEFDHRAIVRRVRGGLKVQVGVEPHPMCEDHYIQWVEVISGQRSCRQFLEPGQLPEAVFDVHGDDITVRQYCSQHGLWRSDANPQMARQFELCPAVA